MVTICTDLRAELASLDTLISPLDDAAWHAPTPAVGWMIRDQIAHLGATDRIATMAASDPARFQADVLTQDRQTRGGQALATGRTMTGADLLVWWRAGWQAMLEVFLQLDSKARIPWFGPAMGAVSFATARLMEAWAHGQDIVDALTLTRPATDRLYHVAHIGVLARPFSYRTHGKEPPTEDVHVALLSPTGAQWAWGKAQAQQRIRGTALDFCLVVTQRRHVADTDLHLEGHMAIEWMSMAQAFAGPAGPGRQPGQFPRRGNARENLDRR
jgi:uncharacterized protein (TIGR03084 family)